MPAYLFRATIVIDSPARNNPHCTRESVKKSLEKGISDWVDSKFDELEKDYREILQDNRAVNEVPIGWELNQDLIVAFPKTK